MRIIAYYTYIQNSVSYFLLNTHPCDGTYCKAAASSFPSKTIPPPSFISKDIRLNGNTSSLGIPSAREIMRLPTLYDRDAAKEKQISFHFVITIEFWETIGFYEFEK